MIETLDAVTVRLMHSSGSDEQVAKAAWVSTYGDAKIDEVGPKGVKKLVQYLYRNKHLSPFEHGSYTFFVECPIFVAREYMRHRTFSYNETSGRYKEMEGRFYLPNRERPLVQDGKPGNYVFVPGNDEQFAIMQQSQKRAFKVAWEEYQLQKRSGIANEVARNVLPLSLMTQFYATANPRNVLQFLTLRDAPNALQEIQWVAQAMDVEFAKTMPITHEAYFKGRNLDRAVAELIESKGYDEVFNIIKEAA